ncbi:DUF3175 domain-containing protein [Burkholderia sp. Bp8963]|uniref:DUF3175 domain-containing protein n=1 Tax=Burkholderia sp. Bp8963 TaxID=2184547 RepID=UPI000F594157|nr:DUF3175 domain-containing protein [Burkholderia sp. Bp8963]RQS76864.1 DUF3175 domain-containing protein [Burkholderia sp. Bp8963]
MTYRQSPVQPPARRPSTSHRKTRDTAARQPPPEQRWSQSVTEHSDALDLEPGTFTHDTPEAVAQALKRAAERSTRRKGTPFQSAMAMLNFYINRAGVHLPQAQRDVLEQAKQKLREAFGRDA